MNVSICHLQKNLWFRIELSHHQQTWPPLLSHSYTIRCCCLTLPSEFILFKYKYTPLHSFCGPLPYMSAWIFSQLNTFLILYQVGRSCCTLWCRSYTVFLSLHVQHHLDRLTGGASHAGRKLTQVESSRLRLWLLADDMSLGKTMSALIRMLIYTRDQLVEFELELKSKDEK